MKKRVSPHVFRHSFATHLHQKGVDINRMARLLGHSNIEKTAIYTHTDRVGLDIFQKVAYTISGKVRISN